MKKPEAARHIIGMRRHSKNAAMKRMHADLPYRLRLAHAERERAAAHGRGVACAGRGALRVGQSARGRRQSAPAVALARKLRRRRRSMVVVGCENGAGEYIYTS